MAETEKWTTQPNAFDVSCMILHKIKQRVIMVDR